MGKPLSIAYVLVEWLNNRAHCTCGWAGKRRVLQGFAVLDVVEHCVTTKHKPAEVLLVRPVANAP